MSVGAIAWRPRVTRHAIIVAGLILLVVAFFWLGSRYPAIDEKAALAGETLLEDVLSFEAEWNARQDAPTWERVLVSTLNWAETNKEGMAFGLVLASLILTFLRVSPGRSSRRPLAGTIRGTLLGMPLGVCVNCAAPISKGMYRGGASAEASLATLISSPSLNIIVLTMTFSLLPVYMAVSKLLVTAVLLLSLPILVRYLGPDAETRAPVVAATSASSAPACAPQWLDAGRSVGLEILRSFGYLALRTVPLMLLAGLLGVAVATLVPLEALADRSPDLIAIAVVALVGTFLPVPIAFDVVLVQALLLAGLPPEFALPLLITLGTFSIYPLFILWTTMTRRLALGLFAAVAALGVLSGVLAGMYEERRSQQLDRTFEAHFGSGSQGSGTGQDEGQAGSAGPGSKAAALLHPDFQRSLVYEGGAVFIQGTALATRSASDTDVMPFSRVSGRTVGIEAEAISGLDLLMPLSQGRGIASGDYDRDGWVDLALASRRGVRLYRNTGGSQFTLVPLPQLNQLNVRLVALVDVNNDGWLDLFIGAVGTADYVLLSTEGEFANEIHELPHNGALFTEAASFFDVDRDSDLDFVKGHWYFVIPRTAPSDRARNYLVKNGPSGFEQAALDEITGETLTALFSDFNSDGHADLVIGNDFVEPDIYYLGVPGGGLEQLRAGDSIPVSTMTTMSADTADINNDLVLDIYLTGKTNDFSTRRDAAREAEEDMEARILQVRSRNRAFEEQYCAEAGGDETDRAACEHFMTLRKLVRTQNMAGCRALGSKDQADDCVVAIQLLRTFIKRDPRLCEMIPERFVEPRLQCHTFVDYHQRGDSRAGGYQYLDRGAIPQASQGNVLLLGASDGSFREVAEAYGVNDGYWSWNGKFADLNNDEWQDIYVANGWWLENSLYPNKLFLNDSGKRFVSAESSFGLDSRLKESSYTYFDLDNDGDLDVVTRAMHGHVNLYVNNERQNHSIVFTIEDMQGNRFGIGTKIYISYGKDERQVREIKMGSGYLSFDAPHAHFGLGSHAAINGLEIHWSTGEKSFINEVLEADHRYTIRRENVTTASR